MGDIHIFEYSDFTKCVAKLKHPSEWNEAM
jgi:hypothetical protein